MEGRVESEGPAIEGACECVVCLEEYTSEGAKVPLLFPCGHSICASCVNQLRAESTDGSMHCPSCRLQVSAQAELTKNFALLEVLPLLRGNKRPTVEDGAPIPQQPKVALMKLVVDDEDEKPKEKFVVGEQRHWGNGWAVRLEDGTWERHMIHIDYTKCYKCSNTLTKEEMSYGMRLCNPCYNTQQEEARRLQIQMHQQMQQYAPKCSSCYRGLTPEEITYKTGLCNGCWEARHCKECRCELDKHERYHMMMVCTSCHRKSKTCHFCRKALNQKELEYQTGLCNSCYDASMNLHRRNM